MRTYGGDRDCARLPILRPNLLVGRSIQAVGACATMVLSRAIARDLFDGQALTKVMALTTIATAAALGFSPLVGSALDYFFGWRSEFALVAIFAICALLAYATLVGETNSSANGSVNPLAVGGSYLGLIRDSRFVVPARTASLMMAGLFAVFSAVPRVLLEHFGFSPVALGVRRRCCVGVWRQHAGARPIGTARLLWRNAGRPGIHSYWSHRASSRCASREELVPAVSLYRSHLPARSGHRKPAVERDGAFAVR